MMISRRSILAAASAATVAPAFARQPTSPSRLEALAIPDLGHDAGPRIRVWLPPDYDRSGLAYRTLYMLDGQYAFAEDSDGVNFAADRRVERLAATDTIEPVLIVAVDNLDRDRFLQYMPQTIYDQSTGELRAAIDRELDRHDGRPLVSGQFIQFLTTTLKPFVDTHYRTLPGRLDTAVFGASMAGVMAGAIFVEAQETFGRGACMSPNWAIYDERFIDHKQLLSIWPAYFARLGAPAGRRLWLDHGTEMMDAGMAPHQAGIAQLLVESGWRRGCHLQTRVYEAGHAFAQTAVQMDEALAWLLA